MSNRVIAIGFAALCFMCFSACGGGWSPHASRAPSVPPPAPLVATPDASEGMVRFLERRVQRDPEDFGAYNKLAAYYLRRQRETGNIQYLELAFRAARASLAIIPAELNTGALAALTQAEFASHEFTLAHDHALELIQIEPDKSYPYMMLGDALLELGDYDEAAAAYGQMEQRGGGITTETRRARLATLHGEQKIAARHLTNAIALALDSNAPEPETVAWCRWQLGETAFTIGDYETAERHYGDALTTLPNYFNALASLGRVQAARGDLQKAIESYEEAVRRFPDPTFVAALGDLYQLAGRDADAAAQYRLVEGINRLSELNGTLYNRQQALFYADHDMKPEEAYANAEREYAVRRDIYGADALAWTALKAGKFAQAQARVKEALRLGTQDAKLFYHAGMIARASGDEPTARRFLQQALTLNPHFDPLQAANARKALGS